MRGNENDNPLGWMTPFAGLPPALSFRAVEIIPQMMEQARAEEREKLYRGLARGNEQKQRDLRARIEDTVKLMADRAMKHNRGGDMSFLEKGYTAWKVIDPENEVPETTRRRHKLLARVQAEVQRQQRLKSRHR